MDHKPYTIHYKPCTIHHTPYAIRHTPYTPHPASFTHPSTPQPNTPNSTPKPQTPYHINQTANQGGLEDSLRKAETREAGLRALLQVELESGSLVCVVVELIAHLLAPKNMKQWHDVCTNLSS